MPDPIIVPPLAGNILGSPDHSFVIAEWRDAGVSSESRPIAPLHLHHHDDEAWYVLEGVLCVCRGNDVIEAPSGSAVFVPRGTSHTYWNGGSALLRYLLIMTPNIYGLIQAIHSAEDRSRPALKSLFAKYDSELLDARQ